MTRSLQWFSEFSLKDKIVKIRLHSAIIWTTPNDKFLETHVSLNLRIFTIFKIPFASINEKETVGNPPFYRKKDEIPITDAN